MRVLREISKDSNTGLFPTFEFLNENSNNRFIHYLYHWGKSKIGPIFEAFEYITNEP